MEEWHWGGFRNHQGFHSHHRLRMLGPRGGTSCLVQWARMLSIPIPHSHPPVHQAWGPCRKLWHGSLHLDFKRWGSLAESEAQEPTWESCMHGTLAESCCKAIPSPRSLLSLESSWDKKNYSGALRFDVAYPIRFWDKQPGTCHFFPLSNFSLLKWECLSYAYPTIIVCKCEWEWRFSYS